VAYGINFVDISGAMVLAHESQRRRKLEKNLYFCRLNSDVYHFLNHGGFLADIHKDHIFHTEYDAIAKIFTHLDHTTCFRCDARIFKECRQIPKKSKGP
jgi:SulP family sulfate permease